MKSIARKLAVTAVVFAIIGWGAASFARHSALFGLRAGNGNNGAVQIKIDNFSFAPQEVVVPAGATVTWTNADDIPHTVTSTADQFKSKALDTDDRVSFTFNEPGTYEYFCSIHPRMTGKIIVK